MAANSTPIITKLPGWDSHTIMKDWEGDPKVEKRPMIKPEEFFREQAKQISIDWQGHNSTDYNLLITNTQKKIVKMMCDKDFKILPAEKQVEILAICQMHKSDLGYIHHGCEDLKSIFGKWNFSTQSYDECLDEECPKQALTPNELKALEDKGLREITIEAIRKKSLVLNTIDNISGIGNKVIGKGYRSYSSIITTVKNTPATLHRLTHRDEYYRNHRGEWEYVRNYATIRDYVFVPIKIKPPEHNQVNNSQSNEEVESDEEHK